MMFVEYNTVVEEQVTVIREYTDSVDNSGNGEYQSAGTGFPVVHWRTLCTVAVV